MKHQYSLPIANGTISPYLLTLAYRYVSAIVPLTSLLVLHAYGPRSGISVFLVSDLLRCNVSHLYSIQTNNTIAIIIITTGT